MPIEDMVKKRNFLVNRVKRTSSTQDEVRKAAAAGAADGWCCVAGEQTAGRGRLGRPWIAPPGTALLASVLLRIDSGRPEGMPFAAGLATVDALLEVGGVQARLKWPNDVLAGGGKLAGILVEAAPAGGEAPPGVIVGLGLNLRVHSFPAGIAGTSLHELTDAAVDEDSLLHAWLGALDKRVAQLEREGLPAVLRDWRQAATGIGEPVTVTSPHDVFEGVALDVADDGALIVQTASGVRRVIAGDVTLAHPEKAARYPRTSPGRQSQQKGVS